VREFLVQERATLVCIQETKIYVMRNSIANETLGTAFDYDYVPAIGVSGGILLGWNTDMWAVSEVAKGRFSISAKIARRGFDSLFFLIGWLIWKERNARTFGRDTTSPAGLQVVIQEEIHAWCLAGYQHLRTLMAAT